MFCYYCFTGIANTMDLPEKLLPRISSRMGIQRLCFAPYNYMQLQEIIGCRLKGIDAFEKQAIEFASRKVNICANWQLQSNEFTYLNFVSCSCELVFWHLYWYAYTGCSSFRRCTSSS